MKELFLLRKSLVMILLVIISTLTYAQVNLKDPIPVAPEIVTGKLANGLTYYIRKNGRPEKKVELRLVVKAGSILESDEQQGLAHFTEHMAFNGSKHFKKNELVSFLQSIGVEFGADLNAYTGFDETVYILPIPTTNPANLEKGFLALEDWASTVTFDHKEIDKERGIVLEESRLGKGASDRMNKVIFPKLFEGSRYANRLPIGKEEILQKFKPELIKQFYRDWYRPDLMAVIAVGDIDPEQGKAMIEKHFGALKNPVNEKKRDYAAVPSRKQSEGLVVTDKEATNNILQIYYSYQPATPELLVEDYRQSIVKVLCNSMLSQRLQEQTQQANPPFLYGGSSLSGFVYGYEVFSSLAVIGKAGVEPAINALLQECMRAKKFGFTEAELDRSKKSIMRSLERGYNERDKTESESYADEFIRNFTEQEPIPGISTEFEYMKSFSQTITLAEVNAFAAKVIPANEPRLVILSGPEKSDITLPTGEQLLDMTVKAGQMEVKAYEEKALASSLMVAPPAPGKLISEKRNNDLDFTELTFGNHVRVILKVTDFKNDQVVMNATRYGGQSVFPTSEMYNAAYSTSIVSQMGVGEFTPTDLKKVLAGKTISVAPRMTMYSEGISGQSGTNDLEALMQMIHLYFTSPRKDEALFSSFVSRQQDYFANVMSNPEAVFQDSIQRVLYGPHARAPRIPTPGDFAKLNLDESLKIFKSRFGNANGFTFCFVGSFDLAKAKELATTYLASLPAAEPIAGFKDIGLRPAKGVIKKEVHKGTEQKSTIRLIFTGEAPYSSEANLRLQALLEVLNIKMTEVLREDLSGVYGAGVSGQLSKNPYNQYQINFSIPCGPENVDKLIAATLGEIKKLKDKGPTSVDLNKVKETWVNQYREDLKDNGYWLSKIMQSLEGGTNPSEILTGEKRIEAITIQELKDSAIKYFDMNNYIQVVLYPDKK